MYITEKESRIMIQRERLLAEFCELVKIDSPSRSERRIADVLKSRLESLHLTVVEDQAGLAIGGDCGNLFAHLKGSLPQAPVLLFSAHMDTVEPGRGVQPVLRDGLLVSEGQTILGADDKSGIAPILEALRVVQEQKIPHGDIQIVFSVAEEGGLNGSKNLDRNLLQADLGFVLDTGGNPGTIVLTAPGQDHIFVAIHGRAAHAGVAPEDGVSAIDVAAKAIAGLQTGRLDEETTCNIGTIQGGLATNIVAEKVEITGESRSRNLGKLEKLTEQMCAAFRRCSEEAGARAEIEVYRMYDPFKVEEEAEVAALAVQGARAAGLMPVFGASGGGSDANYFNQYGVPCVVLATGMQKTHTTEECIVEEDLYRTANLIVEIIKSAVQKRQ